MAKLYRIVTAPYEEREGWELEAMVRDGTVYLQEHLTDQALDAKYVFDFIYHFCLLKRPRTGTIWKHGRG